MYGDILSNNKVNEKPNINNFGSPASSPVAGPVTSPPVQVQPVAPVVSAVEATIAPSPSVTAYSPSHHGRGPLVLTIVGVIIFIGGVSGLFVYALSGQ